ncbi:MAG: hypothetical protein JNK57_00160 [Planctomycetaceae bacterium]|nr:hypothetical protein [Planctomycetaceae bacterium]
MCAKRLGKTTREGRRPPITNTRRVAPGITRFDIEERRTHGYMVRIARQGLRHQKFFSDMKYGGMKKSRAAAVAQYLTWSRELPQRLSTKDRLTSRNQTGRVGVYLAVSRDRAGDVHEAYCASWTDEVGQRHKINFSLQRYGKKNAWQLACLARERMTTNRTYLLSILEKQSTEKKSRKNK